MALLGEGELPTADNECPECGFCAEILAGFIELVLTPFCFLLVLEQEPAVCTKG